MRTLRKGLKRGSSAGVKGGEGGPEPGISGSSLSHGDARPSMAKG